MQKATDKQINLIRSIFEHGDVDFDEWRPVIAEVTNAHAPGYGAMPHARDGFANWIHQKAAKLDRVEASKLIDRVKALAAK